MFTSLTKPVNPWLLPLLPTPYFLASHYRTLLLQIILTNPEYLTARKRWFSRFLVIMILQILRDHNYPDSSSSWFSRLFMIMILQVLRDRLRRLAAIRTDLRDDDRSRTAQHKPRPCGGLPGTQYTVLNQVLNILYSARYGVYCTLTGTEYSVLNQVLEIL